MSSADTNSTQSSFHIYFKQRNYHALYSFVLVGHSLQTTGQLPKCCMVHIMVRLSYVKRSM
jgi:hypothetical protein